MTVRVQQIDVIGFLKLTALLQPRGEARRRGFFSNADRSCKKIGNPPDILSERDHLFETIRAGVAFPCVGRK